MTNPCKMTNPCQITAKFMLNLKRKYVQAWQRTNGLDDTSCFTRCSSIPYRHHNKPPPPATVERGSHKKSPPQPTPPTGKNVPRDYDEPSFFGTYWHFLISVCLSKITPYNVTIATIAIIATIFRRQDSVPAEQSRGQQRGGSCPSCPSSPPTTSTYSTPQVRAFNCCHCKLSTLNTYFCQGRFFVVLLHI